MNINEIAKLAGVSRATVSRYLNNGYVSEEKRKIISKVIQETGYQPSSQAQTLRTKRTMLIGVIIPAINSNTVSMEVSGISDALAKRGYQMILANTNHNTEEELRYLSLFKENQVDGVILLGTVITKKHRQMFEEYKVPLVILGQQVEGYPCIYQDDYRAAEKIADQLSGTGKKYAYITVTDKDEAVGKRRWQGMKETLERNNITLPKERVRVGNFTMESGYRKAKELFEADPSIDTLLCATDTMAMGAMTYLKEAGYKIPQEVQIAGMGDGPLGKLIEPKLTTVRFFYKTSGMEAAVMLIELLEIPDRVGKEIKMGCELVLRKSHREFSAAVKVHRNHNIKETESIHKN